MLVTQGRKGAGLREGTPGSGELGGIPAVLPKKGLEDWEGTHKMPLVCGSAEIAVAHGPRAPQSLFWSFRTVSGTQRRGTSTAGRGRSQEAGTEQADAAPGPPQEPLLVGCPACKRGESWLWGRRRCRARKLVSGVSISTQTKEKPWVLCWGNPSCLHTQIFFSSGS